MRRALVIVLLITQSACAAKARRSVAEATGIAPVIPAPRQSLIPMVHVADAKGWTDGSAPTAAPGLSVKAFARELDHPRWLYVLPNGDVLVAETNGPPRPQLNKGIRGWFMKRYMKKSGALTTSANRITLLRDTDGDGVADRKYAFLTQLNSPFGMSLVGSTLYVANTDALVRFPYAAGDTVIRDSAVVVAPLPADPINYHWTRTIVPSPDSTRMYVAIGSNSNVGERGPENEEGRAAIWEVNLRSGFHRLFATGLRNPVGMAFDAGGTLWSVVNERDELGSDVPPDYLTRVAEGGFYGWPYSYFGTNIDPRVTPRMDLVQKAIVPDYALGPHVAPLGLAYARGTALGQLLSNGMFIGLHGSWNRKPHSGYKVVFVPVRSGRALGDPVDVLWGFLDSNGDAHGRPVGVVLDRSGALLVADDVGNTVWRVTCASCQ